MKSRMPTYSPLGPLVPSAHSSGNLNRSDLPVTMGTPGTPSLSRPLVDLQCVVRSPSRRLTDGGRQRDSTEPLTESLTGIVR